MPTKNAEEISKDLNLFEHSEEGVLIFYGADEVGVDFGNGTYNTLYYAGRGR